MRPRVLGIVAMSVLALVATGCAGGDSRTIVAEPEASKAPKAKQAAKTERIIPLNSDVAEIVWALGLGDRVVGVDVSATYPKAAAAHPKKVGYQRQLSAEGILSLKPTLVVGTDEAGPPDVIDQVRGAGVRTVIVDVPKTPAAVPDKIRRVAEALGVPDKGEVLAGKAERGISKAKALLSKGKPGSKPKVAFVYARGKDTLMLGGVGSRADGMILAAGAIDAGTHAGVKGYVPLTPEGLAKAAPDTLLMLDGGLKSVGGIDGLLKIPGVAQTPAGKNRRVLAYEDQLLLGLGPRTGAALEQLIRGLHPELE